METRSCCHRTCKSTGTFERLPQEMPTQTNAITGTCLLPFTTLRGGGPEIPKRNAQEGETSPTPKYHLHHSRPQCHIGVCGSAANISSEQGQEPRGSQTLPLSFKVSSCICLTTLWALPALFPATRKRKDTISGKVIQTLLSARKCCLETQNTTPEGTLYSLSLSPGVEWGHQRSSCQHNLSIDETLPLLGPVRRRLSLLMITGA